MRPELVICIPGNWKDRSDFLRQVIEIEPVGRYMFAGMMLADVTEKDHVPLEFCDPDPQLGHAFGIVGQGKIPPATLALIDAHLSVVYLHFPLDILDQRERVLKYTQLIQRIGGLAVKVENSGTAHSWERWFAQLSGQTFDVYSAMVTLIGDKEHYYSCGMHHFGLPECEVPVSIPMAEAADLMNRFNFWQIVERPKLQSGHTFSLSADEPSYRVWHREESRYAEDRLFWNPQGSWRLEPVLSAGGARG